MVTDAPMNKDAFSFRNVIKKTLETAGSETPTTEAEQEALVNSMIRTFRRKMERNAESGLAVEVEVPQGEAALSPRELLDPTSPSGLVPVGLFNRWDLAPESFKTCGEHRIVFAKKTDSPGRFFLIFEPALPNPNPAAGFEGCKHLC